MLNRPAPAPAEDDPDSDDPATVDPRPRRLRRLTVGLTLLALLGCALIAISANWEIRSSDDPFIELRVDGRDDDGSCVVTWFDPWADRFRQTDFQCLPADHHDRLVEDDDGLDYGWLVSYWPWRGTEVYTPHHNPTEARRISDLAAMSGVALLLTTGPAALVVGLTARYGFRPRSRTTPPPAPPPLPRLGERPSRPGRTPTYAELRAVARTQFATDEPDDDPPTEPLVSHDPTAPWWRVPELRRRARLPLMTLCLLGSLALLAFAAYLVATQSDNAHQAVASSLLSLGFVAHHTYRSVSSVHQLARHATGPTEESLRYVLLHDPWAGLPVMLLFHRTGGRDATPHSVVELLPRSDDRPPAPRPDGEVRLRTADSSGHFAVPVVDGQALWPSGPRRYLDLTDPEVHDRLRHLAQRPIGRQAPLTPAPASPTSRGRRKLRRKSWLVFSVIAGAAFPLIYVAMGLTRGFTGPDSGSVGAAMCAMPVLLGRYGSTGVLLSEGSLKAVGLFGVVEVPYVSVRMVTVGSGGSLEIHAADGRVVAPICFWGSIIDHFFKTSDKAALAIRERLPDGRFEEGLDVPPVSRFRMRWYWTDGFLLIAAALLLFLR
ncbi:hypothetical protein GL263_06110 [Streptomyces durbertensis]|uniref:Integral membrane protein n=2 Tax=Streptomyces durbertensis TaxID=2448886 RepID=A0ABR6ECT6_9ACTN|nr:hypothetical protein [Streptomyces durbertensis]